jgi:hypothetical protein
MASKNRWRIDTEQIKAPLRTTGALLIGNGPIGFFVLDKQFTLSLAAISMIGTLIVFLLCWTNKPKP